VIAEGDIVLFRFPLTDLRMGKLRPALLLKHVPSGFDDWLVCMISTQLHQQIPGLDLVITPADADFAGSGLKCESLFRLSRLAVADRDMFEGKLGTIAPGRLVILKQSLADWITAGNP